MDDLLNTDSAESVRLMGYNNQQVKRGIAAIISKNGMFSVNCHTKHSQTFTDFTAKAEM